MDWKIDIDTMKYIDPVLILFNCRQSFFMKKFIVFLFLVCGFYFVQAQTIPADSMQNYTGKVVTVCEKIVDTHITKESRVIYLNFGHPYPAQSFTGVIFASDAANFPYDPAVYLKGKNVCITGTVKIYKDRPEIILNRPEQLKIQQ